MLFPIGDDQVKGGHFPLFSYGFILLNLGIYLIQIQFSDELICSFGTIPSNIASGRDFYTLVTSMFLHGGWMHLIGNMLFLWVFADNIEATVGNMRFLGFYLLGGLAAVLTHIYFAGDGAAEFCCSPCGNGVPCEGGMVACNDAIPMVGASGAISAVMGAYLVMFPRSRVKLLFLVFPFRLPAFLFLGFWIGQQWFNGIASLDPLTGAADGVAWWAHIGGAVFGVLVGGLFRITQANHFEVEG